MDKKQNNITEGMFSTIDQIRQDSKDVRDFVKKVFADREFKKMSNDKDFIKYLKSIYEGTMIDEEHVKFSNRTQNGTITTGSVQTTNESVNEAEIKWNAVDNAIVRYIKQNVKVLEKPIKARDEAGTKKMLKGFIDGLVNAQRSLKLESINEANSRDEYDAKEFYGDYKLGIQLHKQFKGRFNKSKFQKTLNDLIQKSKRPESTIKIIGRELNIEPRKLNSYTSGEIIEDQEFIKDSTKKAEQLYKIFISTNESVNEASREAMGIAGFTGTRGSAVQKFIDDYNLNSRKLFNFVKKGKLKDRMEFVTAIAGKRGNKFQGKMVGMFGEGKDDGVPQGYNPMVESKTKESKAVQAIYKYSPKEKKFYDKMAQYEKTIGPKEYGKFIINALRGFGINPRQFKRVPEAEEKIFQTLSQ